MKDNPELWHTSHFDLMDEYDGEIPEHVALYLNEIKTAKTIDAIRDYLKRDSNIVGLDVGCGTGDHAMTLQSRLVDSVVNGLDGSAVQLERARAKGFPNSLIHASMTETGVESESLDFVVAVNSIHHLPSRESQSRAMREFERILKPGGLVLIHEISIRNPLIRLYMKVVFPRTRSIDNGSEHFLRKPPVEGTKLGIVRESYFTFVPDFTPKFLMKFLIPIDRILSRTSLSVLGAHVFWVLQKST